MDRIKRTRPSPALVISLIALSVALGGSALAATAITSKDVNNKGNLTKNAVDTKNIAGKAVTAKKLAKGAVKEKKIKDGAVSSSKLGEITKVSETSPPAAVPAINATATCPDGSKVVGGGFSTTPGLVVHNSERSNSGWRADATANAPGQTVTAHAYCLENSNG
jgi:hypothetical protein